MIQKENRYCAYQKERVKFSKFGDKFSELVCEQSAPIQSNQHICDARCVHSVTSAAAREAAKPEPSWMIEEALRMAGAQDYTSEEYISQQFVCDICNASITGREMHILKYNEILNATNRGYVPAALTNPQVNKIHLEGAKLVKEGFNIDRENAIAWWKIQLDEHVGEDYGICDACLLDIYRYTQQGEVEATKDEISKKPKCWWKFWKSSPTDESVNDIAPRQTSDTPSEKKSFTEKTRKCINCGMPFPEGGLQCSTCGSSRFIWV